VTRWARARRWLRLGPTRAELRDETTLWKARAAHAEQEEKEAHALRKQRGRDAQERIEQADRRRREAEQHAKQQVEQAYALVYQIRREVHGQLNEPDRVDGCSKVRFHREPEAAEWGRHIASRCGENPDVYYAYECRTCPRSPLTMGKYWHAAHDGTAAAEAERAASMQRREDQRRAASRAGRLLKQRVDPRILAQLRKINNNSSGEPT